MIVWLAFTRERKAKDIYRKRVNISKIYTNMVMQDLNIMLGVCDSYVGELVKMIHDPPGLRLIHPNFITLGNARCLVLIP